MTSTPRVHVIKLFKTVSSNFRNKLGFSSLASLSRIVYAGKARTYTRLNWKSLSGTNTLAYYDHE